MSHKGFCDGCGKETQVKKLPIGGGGNLIVCRRCWGKELALRRYLNKKYNLTRQSAWKLPKFS